MKRAIIIVLSVFLVFTWSCGKKNSAEIKATGIVEGDIITLKSQVTGIVESFEYAEGSQVEKGTIIAQVDIKKVKNQLKEFELTIKELTLNKQKLQNKSRYVKENLIYLKKQVARFKRLKKNQSISGEKLENMKIRFLEAETSWFDLEKSKQTLDTQQEKIQNKIEYMNLVLMDHAIKSPVTGYVVEKFVSVGESVFPNVAVADILDISNLYVEVFIEEGEMAHLKLHQNVSILMDGIEDKSLSGIIVQFGKKAEFSPKYIVSEKERKSLLYLVKIKIEEDKELFKIGMPVTVVFKKEQG
jgi:HlyD family secretion protein